MYDNIMGDINDGSYIDRGTRSLVSTRTDERRFQFSPPRRPNRFAHTCLEMGEKTRRYYLSAKNEIIKRRPRRNNWKPSGEWVRSGLACPVCV